MSTLSIHPIEYLREHVDHAHITKKLLRLVMLIALTFCLAGGLYNTLAYINTAERDVVTQTYMNAFPSEMPDVAIYPLVNAPLY